MYEFKEQVKWFICFYEQLLAAALETAVENAVKSGADRSTVKTIEMEDLPIAYLPGHAIRARVRVVGDIARRPKDR